MYAIGAEGEVRCGIAEEDGTIRALAGSPFDSLDAGEEVAQLDQVQVLAPVAMPRIIGVGLNYAAHAAEGGKEPPADPMLFMLPSTAVIGHEDEIVYPLQGEEVAYEGELAVVIGKKARRGVASACVGLCAGVFLRHRCERVRDSTAGDEPRLSAGGQGV